MFLNKCYFYCTLSRQTEFWNYPKLCLSEIGSAPFISDNQRSTVFAIKNRDLFKSKSEIHSINTKHGTDLHPPISNLTTFQKVTFYLGIKVLNYLPFSIKDLSHKEKQFRPALRRFLLTNSLYSLDKYFNWNLTKYLGP
jgi:hypothetical protein